MANGQNQKTIDSLALVHKSATHDTTRVNALLEIAGATYLNNPDTAIVVCEHALEIAKSAYLIAKQELEGSGIKIQRGVNECAVT